MHRSIKYQLLYADVPLLLCIGMTGAGILSFSNPNRLMIVIGASFLVLGVFGFIRREMLKTRVRRSTGILCINCLGYDVSGRETCPECGARVDQQHNVLVWNKFMRPYKSLFSGPSTSRR